MAPRFSKSVSWLLLSCSPQCLSLGGGTAPLTGGAQCLTMPSGSDPAAPRGVRSGCLQNPTPQIPGPSQSQNPMRGSAKPRGFRCPSPRCPRERAPAVGLFHPPTLGASSREEVG